MKVGAATGGDLRQCRHQRPDGAGRGKKRRRGGEHERGGEGRKPLDWNGGGKRSALEKEEHAMHRRRTRQCGQRRRRRRNGMGGRTRPHLGFSFHLVVVHGHTSVWCGCVSRRVRRCQWRRPHDMSYGQRWGSTFLLLPSSKRSLTIQHTTRQRKRNTRRGGRGGRRGGGGAGTEKRFLNRIEHRPR